MTTKRRGVALSPQAACGKQQQQQALLAPRGSRSISPSTTTMLSMALYTTLSALVSSVIVTNAFMARKQFYPTVIYLATSKTNVMVLCNMALCVMVLVWKVVKFVFFGALRHAEVERLSERARNAVFTTCLMVTMFREDIGLEFGANFSLLLFVKSFHWLSACRPRCRCCC